MVSTVAPALNEFYDSSATDPTEQKTVGSLIDLYRLFQEATNGAWSRGELPAGVSRCVSDIAKLVDNPATAQTVVENLGRYRDGMLENTLTAETRTADQARARLLVLLEGVPEYDGNTIGQRTPTDFADQWYNPGDRATEARFRNENRDTLWGRMGSLDVSLAMAIRQGGDPIEVINRTAETFLRLESEKPSDRT